MSFFRNRTAILAGLAALLLCLGGESALAADAMNAAAPDKSAVEKIIRDYLMKHPEIVNEAMEAHRRNEAAKEEESIRQTIAARRNEIRHDPDTVVGGNPNGDVTVVEFFDYRCGVCKRVHPIVEELLRRDGKIRLVLKEWPILGPQSVYASRAAIASRKQGDKKYLDFHNRMMAARTSFTPDAVLKLAASAGLDPAQLKRDMGAPEIDRIIQRNYELAQALRLNGTPSFMIDDSLVRGARDLDTMLKMVRDARKKS